MSWLLAIIVGGVAGWLASVITGSSNGAIINIILGIVGGIFGSWILAALGVFPKGNIMGILFTSVIGAIALILIGRLLTGGAKDN